MLPVGSRRRRWLNQSTHSKVVNSTASKFRHGPPMDDLGLVKTVDRFSESVVVGVANTSDRRLDARFRQPFGIVKGHILRSAVGMVNQSATVDGMPIMKRLVLGVEHKARMGSTVLCLLQNKCDLRFRKLRSLHRNSPFPIEGS